MAKHITAKQSILVSLGILSATAVTISAIFLWPKAPLLTANKSSKLSVNIITSTTKTRPIALYSRGFVEAKLSLTLVSPLNGTVTQVSENFENGAYINKGDELLRIDPSEIKLQVSQAKADYQQAALKLFDLQSLLNTRKHKSTTQQPRIDAAQALTDAAKEKWQFLQQQLQQSTVTAPFVGRIQKIYAKPYGQLQKGMPIADIYSSQQFRIHLRIDNAQLDLLATNLDDIVIQFKASNGESFTGKAISIEPSFNKSQHSFLIVDIIHSANNTQLFPSLLLEASILSRPLKNLSAIANSAVRDNSTLYIVDDNQRLAVQAIAIIHRDEQYSYTQSLKAGTQIISSPLSQAIIGSALQINRPITQQNND